MSRWYFKRDCITLIPDMVPKVDTSDASLSEKTKKPSL